MIPGYLHNEEKICGFGGEYSFLSNFEPCEIVFEGLEYKSSEAAYQAAKCKDLEERKRFVSLPPGKSKRLGKEVEIREDWSKVKIEMMYTICKYKFTKNADLKEKLISTGDKYLEETNYWGDRFWGVCEGTGTNNLGRVLMDIRKEFKQTKLI